MRKGLDRIGSAMVLLLAVGTLSTVAVSASMRLAAEDLQTAVSIARGTANSTQVRTPYGIWASRLFAGGVSSADLDAENARGLELGYRSDRLRELAAVPALIGLIAALLTASPSELETAARRVASQPTAKTTSNGTA